VDLQESEEMSKVLLLRVFGDKRVKALYGDGLSIEEIRAIEEWCSTVISQKKAMGQKEETPNA
jgi:hypothetical protein